MNSTMSNRAFSKILIVIILAIIVIGGYFIFDYFRFKVTQPEQYEAIIKETRDKTILLDLRKIGSAGLEEIYVKDGSYSKMNCSHPALTSTCEEIERLAGEKPTIYSSKDNYCVYVKLLSGKYGCTSEKIAPEGREITIFPGGIGYCDGITFVCP